MRSWKRGFLATSVSTNPGTQPKAIFVSALRDKPLAANFEFEVKGQEQDFQTGLTALSKIAKTYLGVGEGSALTSMKNAEVTVFQGKCPAGNVGVQQLVSVNVDHLAVHEDIGIGVIGAHQHAGAGGHRAHILGHGRVGIGLGDIGGEIAAVSQRGAAEQGQQQRHRQDGHHRLFHM